MVTFNSHSEPQKSVICENGIPASFLCHVAAFNADLNVRLLPAGATIKFDLLVSNGRLLLLLLLSLHWRRGRLPASLT